jgi:hypothetical protein
MMQVDIYFDEVWPAMFVESTRGHDDINGTIADIPESLYDEWVAVNKARRMLAAKISEMTGVKP